MAAAAPKNYDEIFTDWKHFARLRLSRNLNFAPVLRDDDVFDSFYADFVVHAQTQNMLEKYDPSKSSWVNYFLYCLRNKCSKWLRAATVTRSVEREIPIHRFLQAELLPWVVDEAGGTEDPMERLLVETSSAEDEALHRIYLREVRERLERKSHKSPQIGFILDGKRMEGSVSALTLFDLYLEGVEPSESRKILGVPSLWHFRQVIKEAVENTARVRY